MKTIEVGVHDVSYKKNNGPVTSPEEAKTGVNCQWLVHTIYREGFGAQLPIGMWSQEMFEDETVVLRTVKKGEPYVLGDIFLFGRKKSNPKELHLAVHTGRTNDNGEPMLVHATFRENGVTVWSLGAFARDSRYEKLHGVKRLHPDLFDTNIRPLMYTHEITIPTKNGNDR